jgi:hypothetical protein
MSRSFLLQDLRNSRTPQPLVDLPCFLLEQGKIMRLHLISGAVLVYTALALAAICLAELGVAPQNVPF